MRYDAAFMSYVVSVWEQPAGTPPPASIEEAVQLVDRLCDGQPGQNPKFILLAQRLTRRYPCITTLDEDEIPQEQWAWSDGPLDGKTDDAVLNLGLTSDMADEVQPFVAVTANALGLNVLDPQGGDVYLADGRVISDRPAAHCVRADAAYQRGDFARAAQAYRRLAAAGNQVAQDKLGGMYLKGEGVPCSRVVACALFLLTAETDKQKQWIAAGVRTGKLAPTEVVAARHLADQLAIPGNFSAALDGCKFIDSPEYLAGNKAAREGDYAAALRLLMPLAESGHPDAAFVVGMMYADGRGVAADAAQAAAWYRRAADNGSAWGATNLAAMYEHGKGLAGDDAKAAYWYRRAAALGASDAAGRLAFAYAEGKGVPASRMAALALALVAQAGGVSLGGGLNLLPDEKDAAFALWQEMRRPGNLLTTLDRHLAKEAKEVKARLAPLRRARWVLLAAIACQSVVLLAAPGSLPARSAAVLAAALGIYAAVVVGRKVGTSMAWIAAFAFGLSLPMFGILPAVILLIMVMRALAD